MTLEEALALILRQRELYGDGYVKLALMAKELDCMPVHDVAMAMRETYGLGRMASPAQVQHIVTSRALSAATLSASEVAEELCAVMHASPHREFARSELLGRIGRDVRESVYQRAIAGLCYAGRIRRYGLGKTLTYQYVSQVEDDGRAVAAVG